MNYFKLAEVKELLEKNSDGHAWSEANIEDANYFWTRSDGGKAHFTRFYKINIESGAFEKLSEQGKEQEKQKLENQRQNKLKKF